MGLSLFFCVTNLCFFRYIVLEIKEQFTKELEALTLKPASLYAAINGIIQQLHGDFGAAAIMEGFMAKYCNKRTKIAVIKCRHGPHKLVTSSIPFIKRIESKNVSIHILYIGATIKHCFKFVSNFQQKKFDEYCVTLKTDEERKALQKEIMNLDPVKDLQDFAR